MKICCGQCGRVLDAAVTADTFTCPQCGHAICLSSTKAAGESPPDEKGFAQVAQESMQKKVTVQCSACRRRLVFNAQRAGRTFTCPLCGVKGVVPYRSDEQLFDVNDTSLDPPLLMEDLESKASANNRWLSDPRKVRKVAIISWLVLAALAASVWVGLLWSRAAVSQAEKLAVPNALPVRPAGR